MALTPELEIYYDNLDEMFGTMGWRQLLEDASDEIRALQESALNAASYEEVMYMRGQADVLTRLISLRDMSEAIREQQADPDVDLD